MAPRDGCIEVVGVVDMIEIDVVGVVDMIEIDIVPKPYYHNVDFLPIKMYEVFITFMSYFFTLKLRPSNISIQKSGYFCPGIYFFLDFFFGFFSIFTT